MNDKQNWLDINKLRLSIVPTQLVSRDGIEDLNSGYEYFKKTWKRVLDHLAGPNTWKCEIMFSSHYMLTIFYQDTAVAQLFCRVLNLDLKATYDLSYYADFMGVPHDYLVANGCRRALTLEWNSVASRFSRRKCGLPFVEMTMQLAIFLARQLGVEACVGVPRRITGVDDVGSTFGFKHLREDLVKYNCPVNVSVGLTNELQLHPDPHIRSLINLLWAQKSFVLNPIEIETIQEENENDYRRVSGI